MKITKDWSRRMKTTKEKIEVMQGYEEGKDIEVKFKSSDIWVNDRMPDWDWSSCDYRIKPEPKYGPYESVDELKRDYIERLGVTHSVLQNPDIWVKFKSGNREDLITVFCNDHMRVGDAWYTCKQLYEKFTYLDGTPFGKLVEEK